MPSEKVPPKRSGGFKRVLTLCVIFILALAALRRNGLPENKNTVPDNLPASGVEVPDYVREDLIPVNDYSRPGRWLRRVNGLVIHYVGNPGSSAKGNRDYFASLASGRTGVYASSHFVVGLEGEVVQCIPLTEVAYASNDRNGDTIAIEVCHPDEDGRFSDVTYARLMDLAAWLCITFELDPETDVIRHYDVSGKECPRYYVRNPAAWEQLKTDLSARLKQMTEER